LAGRKWVRTVATMADAGATDGDARVGVRAALREGPASRLS